MEREYSLKPCPFCGGENVFIANPLIKDFGTFIDNAKMQVVCADCQSAADFGFYIATAQSKLTQDDVDYIYKKCEEKWNKRAK